MRASLSAGSRRLRAIRDGDVDHEAAARPQHPVQFAQARVEVGPDRHVVDGHHVIHAAVGQPGPLGRAQAELDPARADRRPVDPGRVGHHLR
jgi:hypothetical protein